MKIRNNITILINEYWLRNITRHEQYYNLSLVSYKFLILNLSLTITSIKLETFFASKSQRGECPPAPLYPPLLLTKMFNQTLIVQTTVNDVINHPLTTLLKLRSLTNGKFKNNLYYKGLPEYCFYLVVGTKR